MAAIVRAVLAQNNMSQKCLIALLHTAHKLNVLTPTPDYRPGVYAPLMPHFCDRK